MSVEPKALWTEDDFDQMGWHDCRVHGFSFSPPSATGWSVALDIDYILEWVDPTEPGGNFSFWVAPATLVFPYANDVILNVEMEAYQELEIDAMTRRQGSEGTHDIRWSIAGSFNLDLSASSYQQYIRATPVHIDLQALSPEQRGGVSFATVGYR